MHKNDLESLGIKLVRTPDPTEEEIQDEYAEDMWVNEERKVINENTFAKCFRDVHHLQYSNGMFYTKTGKANREVISREIWISIADAGITQNVGQITDKLFKAVQLASTIDGFKTSTHKIPFSNGDLLLNPTGWEFHLGEFSSTPYRLNVRLSTKIKAMPTMHKWLHDLFYEDDIPVIQEFLGYCLLPSTKAQEALFLVGEAGTGKSTMGAILDAILGEALLAVPNTQDFLQGQHNMPELENMLVLYDDDLDNSALEGTGLYKKLITNDLNITADRKYGQPFKFKPYVRLIACTNEMITSRYDNTAGFYRRLHPVLVKPKAEDFVPDRKFRDKIRAEAESIVQWSLIGLRRVIEREYEITHTARTDEYLQQRQSLGDPMPDFLTDCFEFVAEEATPTKDIYRYYEMWCNRNGLHPRGERFVSEWFSNNQVRYPLKHDNHIKVNGKNLRGYRGLKVRSEWLSNGTIQLK